MRGRWAALAPRALAAMHGASFRGDGSAEIDAVRRSLKELLAG